MDDYLGNMKYETFIRGAFSIEKDNMVDRWGDPAGLANTDEFSSPDNLSRVKVGVGYSIAMYNHYILNNCEVSSTDSERMDNMIDDVVTAESHNDILKLIEEYKKYRDKYYTFKWKRE